ncbi:hypothetical protein ACWDKQ_33595, partial [Saccharopolyspora sp. NPDC000995]
MALALAQTCILRWRQGHCCSLAVFPAVRSGPGGSQAVDGAATKAGFGGQPITLFGAAAASSAKHGKPVFGIGCWKRSGNMA